MRAGPTLSDLAIPRSRVSCVRGVGTAGVHEEPWRDGSMPEESKGLTGILRLGLGRLGWEKERGGTGEACEDRAKVNGADRRCRLHLKPRL